MACITLPASSSSCIAASVASSVVGARITTARSPATSTSVKVAPVVRCQAVSKGDNAVPDRRAVMVAAAASVLAMAAPVFAVEEGSVKAAAKEEQQKSKYGSYGNICAALPTGSKCHPY